MPSTPRQVPGHQPHKAVRKDLTRRQREIISLISLGCTQKRVATTLQIQLTTVQKHLRVIRKKLNAPTTLAAAVTWRAQIAA